MKMFGRSMSKESKKWYVSLPLKTISSFHQFVVIFKEACLNKEDRDLVRNSIGAMLWVEICKIKA